jgi:PhzF family phenazine biosynthesis protein
MSVPIVQVDAFTDTRFAGNPAAVCVLPAPADDRWMQQVAQEMNLSETAFLVRRDDAWQLRWFTPTVEVDLCGHATLASAHVLWEEGHLSPEAQARFDTLSGRLTADRRGKRIEMDFPAQPEQPTPPPAGLLDALGSARARYVGKSRTDFIVEVGTEQEVRALTPDFTRLRQCPVRGVIVTSRSSSGDFDFVSRFFAPASGVDEDPATGSAHCCLAPYWGGRLGKTEMVGYQASARGGVVAVRLMGDRVRLGGQAVTVLRGQLLA